MAAENPETIRVSDAAWKCLQGAYDLQIHVGPDVIGRRIDDIDCAKEFLQHGHEGVRAQVALRADRRARAGRDQGRARHQGVRRHHAQSQRRRAESGRRRAGGTLAVQDRLVSDGRRGERDRRPLDVAPTSCRSGRRFSASWRPKASRRPSSRSSTPAATSPSRRGAAWSESQSTT